MKRPAWYEEGGYLPGEKQAEDLDDLHAAGALDDRLRQIMDAYPYPHEARELLGNELRREILDTDDDAVQDVLDKAQDALEDSRDTRMVSLRLGIDPYAGQRLLPRLLDEDMANRASQAILRDRTEHAPDPIEGLVDGDVAMVGSLPGGTRCGEHMVLRCQPCFERWDDPDAYDGHPHPYTKMRRPAGCETPDCQVCKDVYVPTRAAAAALRVQHALREADQDYVLRHCIVSPPWRTLNELAHVHDGPISRDTISQLETEVAELVMKKGAVGCVLARHPWRGWWGPDHDWREGWHWHVLAAFPKDAVPEHAPQGWTREFFPGGATCCACREGTDGSCCDGTCKDATCPQARVERLKREKQRLGGLLGAARSHDQATRAQRLQQRLDHADHQLDEARKAMCDRDWLFHVTQTRDGAPKTVATEPHELQGGACEGLKVPSGVLALVQYELDHAGAVRDPNGQTRLHTLKWYGAWGYNQLDLREHEHKALHELKEGGEHGVCPNCGNDAMLPVHRSDEAAKARRLLEDTEIRALQIKKRLKARQLGWIEPPETEVTRPEPGGLQGGSW